MSQNVIFFKLWKQLAYSLATLLANLTSPSMHHASQFYGNAVMKSGILGCNPEENA